MELNLKIILPWKSITHNVRQQMETLQFIWETLINHSKIITFLMVMIFYILYQ